MDGFHLRIVTPDGLKFDGEVKSLLVRTDDGDVEFLRGHIDYFAHLSVGRARLIVGDATRYASVNGGCVVVSGGEVTLTAITLEFAEDIDLERAVAARESAEKKLSGAKDSREIDLARAKLMRAMNRINVAELI